MQRSRTALVLSAAAAVGAMGIAPDAGAALIGVDFMSTANGGQTPMLLTETAGVVPQQFWNSVAASTTAAPLLTSTGFLSGATVTVNAAPTWSVPYTETTNGDFHMMDGLLDPTSAALPAIITISGLLDDGVPGFTVYVYRDSDADDATRVGTYTISGATAGNATITGTGDPSNNDAIAPFEYFQVDPDGPTETGNYIVFNGVSGSTFTLTATPSGGATPRSPVNGIQIDGVSAVPEPAGLAVAGVAAMGLLRRRRRA